MNLRIPAFALGVLASSFLGAQTPYGAQQAQRQQEQAMAAMQMQVRMNQLLRRLSDRQLKVRAAQRQPGQGDAPAWLSQPPSKVEWRVQGVGGERGPSFDGERLIFRTKFRQIQSVDPGSGVVRWSIPEERSYEIPPLLLSNRLISISPDYALTILDADRGKLVRKIELNEWKNFYVSSKANHPRVLFPAIEGGRLLVATFGRDPEGNTNGRLHAYDLDKGEPVWEFQIPGGPDTDPMVFKDHVILGGESGVWSLDLKDGKPAWSLSRKAGDPLLEAAIVDGKLILSSEKSLMALDPDTGRQVWSVPAEMSMSCLMGGSGYLVAREFKENWFTHGVTLRTAGFDLATGKRLWETDLFAGSLPWVQADRLYGCVGREVFGLDLASGKQLWTYKLARGLEPRILPIEDTVLVHCEREGKTSIYALGGADGKARWVYEVEGGRGSLPILPTRQGFLLPYADEQLLSVR